MDPPSDGVLCHDRKCHGGVSGVCRLAGNRHFIEFYFLITYHHHVHHHPSYCAISNPGCGTTPSDSTIVSVRNDAGNGRAVFLYGHHDHCGILFARRERYSARDWFWVDHDDRDHTCLCAQLHFFPIRVGPHVQGGYKIWRRSHSIIYPEDRIAGSKSCKKNFLYLRRVRNYRRFGNSPIRSGQSIHRSL